MNIKLRVIILTFLIIFLFTGCTATADINLNHDGKITEKIDVVSQNSKIQYGDKSIKESIELFLKKYDTALKVGKYNTVINTGKDNSGVTISRSYDNICSFVNGTIFSQYVHDEFYCTQNDYYYEIKSVGPAIKNTDRYDTWLAPDNIDIKVTLPVSAEENNADYVDGNTYVWKYGSNVEENKNFYLKISKMSLKENEIKYNESLKNKKRLKYLYIIGFILVIFIILFIIGKLLYKKYKKNKLDY